MKLARLRVWAVSGTRCRPGRECKGGAMVSWAERSSLPRMNYKM